MEQIKKLFEEMLKNHEEKIIKFNEEMIKKHEASQMNLISCNLISKSVGSTLLKVLYLSFKLFCISVG